MVCRRPDAVGAVPAVAPLVRPLAPALSQMRARQEASPALLLRTTTTRPCSDAPHARLAHGKGGVSWAEVETAAGRPERQPGTRSSRRLLSVKWSTLPSLAVVVGRGGRGPPQLDLDARSP
jgi:hypothetical protein